jgi:hypothetical protein
MFTNEFGQKFVPGDECIIVTVSAHNVHTRKGVFVGMCGKGVQVKSIFKQFVWIDKATGKRGWNGSAHSNGTLSHLNEDVEKITTLQYNRIFKV